MTCLHCNKEFEKSENNYSPNEQKFCRTKCRSRYNSKKRYNRLKNDPDFNEKKKIIFRNWYQRNKEKHKERVLTKYYKNKGRSVLIIGCGLFDSGTDKLAGLLGGCNESSMTYKPESELPFKFDLDKLKEKLKLMDLTKKYTGDVDENYLNYAEYFIGKVKNVKIVCMFTDKISGEYSKAYYVKAMELATKYPFKFKIADIKLLRTKEGIKEIFSFCGIEEADRNYQI
jgi:hypothetical protein